VTLDPAGDGVWRVRIETETLGLHRIEDAPESRIFAEGLRGDAPSSGAPAWPDDAGPDPRGAGANERVPLSTVAVVGPPSPKEFADPVARLDALADLVAETGGSSLRLGEDGAPALRRVREGAASSGDGWIGLTRREAYEVTGASLGGVLPGWVFFALAALFTLAAWRVEGK
ncbi:MAG: hypothetical protein AAFR16_13890, partial [Pseudomonadota bacterium]